MLHRDSPPPSIDDTTFAKCLIKHELQEDAAFFLFNAYYKGSFKGLDVHHFQNYEGDPPDMGPFIDKLKRIAREAHEEHKLVRRGRVVQSMIELQHREERVSFDVVEYRLEEELQLAKRIIPSTTPMKAINPIKRSERHKQKEALYVVKTSRDRFEIFRKKT